MFERGFREREREGRVREGRDERGEERDCDKFPFELVFKLGAMRGFQKGITLL